MNYNLNLQKSNLKQRPIPNLKDTVKNYLKFTKPFLQENKEDVEKCEKKLQEYIKKSGAVLQKRLLDRSKELPSWLMDYLIEDKILTNREPIPIQSNYYILYDFGFKDQIDAVAKVILSSILLKKFILNGKISQITNKCPFQYYLFFHSCRDPSLDRDKLLLYDLSDNKYVILIYKNIFWMLEATLDYDKICDQISYITSLDLAVEDGSFFGFLTSGERNECARVKEKFYKISERNREFLYYLDRSMMIFSLDDKASTDLNLEEINNLCWFGEGSNHYYNKLVEFLVLKDGYVAMSVVKGLIEPSTCHEFARMILEWTINNEITYSSMPRPSTNPILLNKNNSNVLDTLNPKLDDKHYMENFSYKPIKLNYDLNYELKTEIHNFRKNCIYKKSLMKTDFLTFNDYGRVVFERKGLIMSSFIQLAILAAYYRTFNKIVPSRQFVCGRNYAYSIPEWIRTTTKEAANFSIAINEMKIPRDLKIKLGLDAFKQHKNNAMDIENGRSIDSHLLGLASVLEPSEKRVNTVNMFPFIEDETINHIHKITSNWVIDTYPTFHEFVKLSSHPPPCEEGISLTYIVRKDHIQFIGSAYFDLRKYFEGLVEILREMKDLFIQKEREFANLPKF